MVEGHALGFDSETGFGLVQARAGRAHLLGPHQSAQLVERRPGSARLRAGDGDTGLRVVALLLRHAASRKKLPHPGEVLACAPGCLLGLRDALDRLRDVLLARPAEREVELGPRQVSGCARLVALQAQLGVVEGCDGLSLTHSVALARGKGGDAAADLARDAHLGGLQRARASDAPVPGGAGRQHEGRCKGRQ